MTSIEAVLAMGKISRGRSRTREEYVNQCMHSRFRAATWRKQKGNDVGLKQYQQSGKI
jgi:hypothetical protein